MHRYSRAAARRWPLRAARVLAAGLTAASAWSVTPPAVPAAADAGPATDVRVEMREFSFQPLDITVPAGQSVRFLVHNAGVIPHDFGVAGVYDPPQTGIDPQRTEVLTLQFATAGTYFVYCPVPRHVEAGMRTTIRVVSAGVPAAPPADTADTADSAAAPGSDAPPAEGAPDADAAAAPAPEA